MDLRRLIIGRLASHPGEIQTFTDGLDEDQLRERPLPGKWSIHEITMHLAEVQDIFMERVARMLTDSKPDITPFHPDEARNNGLYLEHNFSRRVKDFAQQRTALVSLLETLRNEQWLLEGRHPEIPLYSVEKCMEGLMRHEESHLYQMYNTFFGIRA
jgi:hypothetical protein